MQSEIARATFGRCINEACFGHMRVVVTRWGVETGAIIGLAEVQELRDLTAVKLELQAKMHQLDALIDRVSGRGADLPGAPGDGDVFEEPFEGLFVEPVHQEEQHLSPPPLQEVARATTRKDEIREILRADPSYVPSSPEDRKLYLEAITDIGLEAMARDGEREPDDPLPDETS